ncbi:MAG TPA: hypothetical protein PK252_05360 [Bacteroidales bacterium]|nr:hypothetical protein [Bacteroidales bacterium]
MNKTLLIASVVFCMIFTPAVSQQDSIKKLTRDSLVISILKHRSVIFNFVNHTKLQPKEIQKGLETALKNVFTPEEIVNMAYDPKISRYDFDLLMENGVRAMRAILNDDIIKYNNVPKTMLDDAKYESDKKAAKDTFEMNLKNESAEWYDFYVVKNGVTDDWNRDRRMLNDILNSKSYITYRYALDDARRRYEAPYFKLHQDLTKLRASLLAYNVAAIALFNSYKPKGEVFRSTSNY